MFKLNKKDKLLNLEDVKALTNGFNINSLNANNIEFEYWSNLTETANSVSLFNKEKNERQRKKRKISFIYNKKNKICFKKLFEETQFNMNKDNKDLFPSNETNIITKVRKEKKLYEKIAYNKTSFNKIMLSLDEKKFLEFGIEKREQTARFNFTRRNKTFSKVNYRPYNANFTPTIFTSINSYLLNIYDLNSEEKEKISKEYSIDNFCNRFKSEEEKKLTLNDLNLIIKHPKNKISLSLKEEHFDFSNESTRSDSHSKNKNYKYLKLNFLNQFNKILDDS